MGSKDGIKHLANPVVNCLASQLLYLGSLIYPMVCELLLICRAKQTGQAVLSILLVAEFEWAHDLGANLGFNPPPLQPNPGAEPEISNIISIFLSSQKMPHVPNPAAKKPLLSRNNFLPV